MFLQNLLSAFNNCLLLTSKNATTHTCKIAATPKNINPSFFPQFGFFCFIGGCDFPWDLWWFVSWLECLLSEVVISGAECLDFVGGGGWCFCWGGGGGRGDKGGGGGGGGTGGGDCLDGGGTDCDPGLTFCWDRTAGARKQKQTPKVKINNDGSIHRQSITKPQLKANWCQLNKSSISIWLHLNPFHPNQLFNNK